MIVSGAGVGGGSLVYANTLYEPLAAVLRRPAVAAHHRLARRARAVLRPGQADARRRREPAPHPGRRRDGEGRHRHGRRRHVPPHAGRGVLRRPRPGPGRAGRRPLLRRRRARPQDLHRLRRVHVRLPAQRQEHPGEELPLPRRAERRAGAAAHDGHPGLPARGWRVRRTRAVHEGQDRGRRVGDPHADRRAGGLLGLVARHPAAAAPDARRGPPAARLAAARLPLADQLRVDPRRDRAGHEGRLQPGRRDHVELPPRRAHAHRAGAATARAATRCR